MKKITLFVLLFCFFCTGCAKTPINETPMYGNVPPTPDVKKAHEQFIKEVNIKPNEFQADRIRSSSIKPSI